MNFDADIKKVFLSKTFGGVLAGFCIAVIVLVIFQAGMHVGFRKASFAGRFGDNYYRTFDNHRMGPSAIGMSRMDFVETHGAAGRIVSINLATLVIEDRDGTEKVVLIKKDTVIRLFRKEITSSELAVGDFVVVIGSPNDQAQIEAQLVRLLQTSGDNGKKNK